jgi:hypothetical protein
VRGLLGIGAILFALVLASQVRGPLGDFLIGNWTQFPAAYSRMLGFGLVFIVVSIALVIVIENYYERSPIMPRFRYVDPILGGLLGIVQGGVTIGAALIILDSYFKGVGLVLAPTEILFVRDFYHAIDVSQTAKIFRHDLIPDFFVLFGWIIPEDIRAVFPR